MQLYYSCAVGPVGPGPDVQLIVSCTLRVDRISRGTTRMLCGSSAWVIFESEIQTRKCSAYGRVAGHGGPEAGAQGPGVLGPGPEKNVMGLSSTSRERLGIIVSVHGRM